MLEIQDLTFRIAGRPILDHASATIPAGHKVSLVGRNGTGKSTLLRLIEGSLHADGGEIRMPRGARMGMVAQEAPDGPESLIETVLAADRERADLLAEAETAADPARIAEIHDRLAAIESHTAEARAASILKGLGFDETAQAQPCHTFSGGWRMRVALAAVLFSRPDLLLLDEPTNHLDLEATLWLEGFLRTYPGTALIVSHDRDLLNKVPQTTLHLTGGQIKAYNGGYDQFERQRREQMRHQEQARIRQDAERKRIQAFIDRFRAQANKARQAQSRVKMLEKMEPIVEAATEPSITLDFPACDPPDPPMIAVEDVTLGYDGTPVLKGLTFRIDPDDRIALLGRNGNGKSTLAKLISGRLDPMAGSVTRSHKLSIGYFAQHQQDELDLSLTALEQARLMMSDRRDEAIRAHLGRFGLVQDKALTRIGDLSGGEKARLLLAMMCRETPNLLVLDEPTNHLDIDSREALVQALNAFRGAVVLVTHDPHLIELVADRLWLVSNSRCTAFDGDLAAYRTHLLTEQRTARAENRAASRASDQDSEADAAQSRRDQRKAAAEARKRVAPLRKSMQKLERSIADLTTRKQAIEARLADPALYDGPSDRITALQTELKTVTDAIETAESEWLELAETLEKAD